ncbi:hypothetical protein JM946_17370 [Steroidobacter sp. S1-65]|uniref:Uncharacterized protein n=1 Tax=Steroidobacter gossypii TaxID=2805490 RepID=A0ABS1WZX9_9GAMM|nr:hypothetical protein [Steroidobacter gossypii]MBM0106502.1 hypothetical protein [Steroidobacter gossypii]
MSFGATWLSQFYATLTEDRATSEDLREAALALNLGCWTTALTGVVVHSFKALGYEVASKGTRCQSLPVCREEYLGQDVMVFPRTPAGWRFPAAVCELENAASADLVQYAFWKVLCVRASLRMVFCYRPEPAEGTALVSQLARTVVGAMPLSERASLSGETLVIVGSRDESSTFPYGFFQPWKLSHNTGRFERFAR